MGAPDLLSKHLALEPLTHDAGEVIYASERTRVTRVRLADGRAAVIKQVSGAEAIRALRHEEQLLQRLAGLPGIPALIPAVALQGTAIAMVDRGGTTLANRLLEKPFTIAEAVTIGMQVAQILMQLHRQRVIHKDINPSNLLIHADGSVMLIDFNIASHTAEEQPGFTHQNQIAGTLAYVSPEQTGRTGRPVDHRTDFYALGVTLFELASGGKPFSSIELLDLVRDHLVHTPPALHVVRPDAPIGLSRVIARLLEKEPDRRYQSAEGLLHDLEQLQAGGVDANWQPGRLDFAARLMPPSRLVGRAAEQQTLVESLSQAIVGKRSCLLVSGDPGVGKTALIKELRPLVTLHQGWYVSTKFDQYRQDGPGAGQDALRALGRLLLSEPDDRLASYRERIAAQLGSNIGFGPARLPEFELLLGAQPLSEASNPREAEARAIQTTVDLLRGIASPDRPIALVYDDLQWAPAMTLQLLDGIVTGDKPIAGLLIIGAYRAREVDAAHPLHALMQRWKQLQVEVPSLHLVNLPPADSSQLVADMLRMPAVEATKLADALNEHTLGNPYDTVEMINALRQDGLLVPKDGGWAWQARALRDYVGGASVVDVILRRVDRLPDETRRLLQCMAALGGELPPNTLALATQMPVDQLLRELSPALEDGLLTVEQGTQSVIRFRHDRVHQAAFESVTEAERLPLHLSLARALVPHEACLAIAAEQYMHTVHDLTAEIEKRRVIALFQHAAAHSQVTNVKLSERYLILAIGLLKPIAGEQDGSTMQQLLVDHHKALYSLGRLDDADDVYQGVFAMTPDVVARADSTGIQLLSLSQRARYKEGMALGFAELAELGIDVPDDPVPGVHAGLAMVTQWLQGSERHADFHRPVVDDPRVVAIGNIIRKTGNSAYFLAPTYGAWLALEALRQWIAHGPSVAMMSPAGSLPFILAGGPQKYQEAHELAQHMVAVGEARGLEPGTSNVRYALGIAGQHWAQPLEAVIRSMHLTRANLLRAGDVLFAMYTHVAGDAMLDSMASLDQAEAEYAAGNAFADRIGNSEFKVRLAPRRQLVHALRGTTLSIGSWDTEQFDEAAYAQGLRKPSTELSTYHTFRTITAAIFGDLTAWLHHARTALPLLPLTPGYYVTGIARVLLAAALAIKARTQDDTDKAQALEQLDTQLLPWLRARAADAPQNFRHLLKWVEAERAWTFESPWEAGLAFEQALALARKVSRPWHLGLITERTAQLHLEMDMEKSSQRLIAQALMHYEDWGAAGKAQQLRRDHPHLRAASSLRRAQRNVSSTIVSGEMVDLMAVLRASQALSSQTSLAKLTAELAHVLSAITGATSVHLLLRSDDGRWQLAQTQQGQSPLALDDAGGLLPLSVVRYVERVGELLVLDDASSDDRFASDPCLSALETCSMLAAPLLSQGQLRAMLVLQNRTLRSAFNGDHLDAVQLIAGQLSVSIDNALLYASLEQKVAERTTALEAANAELERLSLTDALTGVANRRRFNESLQAEWMRATRNKSVLGLIILDIDHFKKYNDHYGHQGGDAALQAVAQALGAGRRGGSDLVARYGGEEFVLLLPQVHPVEGCARVAEKVRAAVEALQLPHEKSPFGIVTISVGIATMEPRHDLSPEMLVAQADAALYQAKEQGRNRVVASGS